MVKEMLKISTDKIDKTLRLLDYWYPIKSTVYVKILEGYDSVEAPDGTRGFAVYVPQEKTFYIPTDVEEAEEDAVIHCIAHEYKHAMQDAERKPFDEEEAEQFADKIVYMYKETEDGLFERLKEMVLSDNIVRDPEDRELLRRIEEALGFRLFTWQQTRVFCGTYRQLGNTTAENLAKLLHEELVVMGKPRSKMAEIQNKELEKMYRVLNGKHIETAVLGIE